MNSVQENIPLAPLTTFRIGGPARYFVDASTEDAAIEAARFARDHDLPLLVMGGGSNILVSDAGFDGLVLRAAIDDFDIAESGGAATVRAGAGADWDALVAECVSRCLGGIECLSGIPGWVGATPVQNVGAYGQEVSGVITSVRAYDLAESRIVDLTAAECGFGYRSSVFNTTARGRYLILGVRYALERNRLPDLAYPDLARRFADRTHPPSLTDVRAAVRAIRASKAMLLVDGDPDCRSAGSFFRNPMVSADEVDAVSRVAREQVPSFASEPGRSKVPAAWLIERAGFGKGTARGAAGLSGKHALALINRGGASAMDILRLAGEIQTGVQDRFGVRLVPEPVFVGFPADVVDRHGALSPA